MYFLPLFLYTSLCIDSYSVRLPTDDVARTITEGVCNPLVGVTAGTGLPLLITILSLIVL